MGSLVPPVDWREQVDALLVHHGVVGERDSLLARALGNLICSWDAESVDVPDALVHVWQRNHRKDPGQWGPTEAQVELGAYLNDETDREPVPVNPGVGEVRALVDAAWSLAVEQQHHHSPGWSMSKQWAGAEVRRAFEPFLDADGVDFDWDKVLRAAHRGEGADPAALQGAADLIYPLRSAHENGEASGPDSFYAGVVAARVALLNAAQAATQAQADAQVEGGAGGGAGAGSGVGAVDVHDLASASREALVAHVLRLHSWDGLMELLDEHWPTDIFPTLPDSGSRDPGPRIVSLLRWLDAARKDTVAALDQVAFTIAAELVCCTAEDPCREGRTGICHWGRAGQALVLDHLDAVKDLPPGGVSSGRWPRWSTVSDPAGSAARRPSRRRAGEGLSGS